MTAEPTFSTRRIMHDLRRRRLTVRGTERITPDMLRITFEGDDLADFPSQSPDDHIKLFIPTEQGEVERRDYTPRRFDTAARTLDIDFALHDTGPATRWAPKRVTSSTSVDRKDRWSSKESRPGGS